MTPASPGHLLCSPAGCKEVRVRSREGCFSVRPPIRFEKKTKYTLAYASPPVGLVHDSPVPTLTRSVSAVCHYLPGEIFPSVLWNCSGLAVPCLADVPLCVMIPSITLVSLGDHQQCDSQMYSEGVARHWSLQGHQNYPQRIALGAERSGELVRSGISSDSILTYTSQMGAWNAPICASFVNDL